MILFFGLDKIMGSLNVVEVKPQHTNDRSSSVAMPRSVRCAKNETPNTPCIQNAVRLCVNVIWITVFGAPRA